MFISYGLRVWLKAAVLLDFKSQAQKRVFFCCLFLNRHLFACFQTIFSFVFGSNIGLSLLETKAQPFTGKPAVCLFKIQSELA